MRVDFTVPELGGLWGCVVLPIYNWGTCNEVAALHEEMNVVVAAPPRGGTIILGEAFVRFSLLWGFPNGRNSMESKRTVPRMRRVFDCHVVDGDVDDRQRFGDPTFRNRCQIRKPTVLLISHSPDPWPSKKTRSISKDYRVRNILDFATTQP